MDKPVFIVGPPGSGTTLLRLMLDSHPDLMLARETGFLRSLAAIHHVPFTEQGDRWTEGMGVSRAELDRAIERFYDGVFGLAARRQDARRWGDKTPYHVHFMAEAAEVFADAQFVGIIRHPGACAASAGRFDLTWASGVRLWRQRSAAMCAEGIGLGQRFHLIRYEDLVTDQAEVVRGVLDYLGLPWDDAVLAHHETHSGRMEGGTQAHDPVDTSRMARWRTTATEQQIAGLQRRTGNLSALFGYDPAEGLPVQPLNPRRGGPKALTGTELGRLAIERGTDLSHQVTFQNSAPSRAAFAAELAEAYRLGREGKSLRPPYNRLVDPVKPSDPAPVPEPAVAREVAPAPVGRVAEARRRLARRIDPGRIRR